MCDTVCVCPVHRLLEGDERCHTKIVSRSGSNASMKSANSANSSNSQRDSIVEVEGHQKTSPTIELRTAQPLQDATATDKQLTTPPDQTTPPSSPETPVKSKPAAPYFSQNSLESSQETTYSGEEGEGEGFGPEASIILDDGLGTRIDLETVLPNEGGVANGSGQEEEAELEIPNEIGLDMKKPENLEVSRTSALSEKGKERSEEHTDGSHDGKTEGTHDQEEEERDVLSELKPGLKGEKGSGTVKRTRSETEAGRKVSLASLVGRVRSQTIQDGSVKDKHLATKVGCCLH